MAIQIKSTETKREALLSIKTPIPLCKEEDFYVETQYFEDDDRVQIIIGITIGNGAKIDSDIKGQHTFIMYFDDINFSHKNRNCKNDIMLDASGSYGVTNGRRGTSTDIVLPQYDYDSITISIRGYINYFKGQDETLYAYTFYVPRSIGEVIKKGINEHADRPPISIFCTVEATEVLINSGMLNNLESFFYPIKLKKYLDNYQPPEYDNSISYREKISIIKKEKFNLK